MSKSTKAEEFATKERKEYTVKVTSIIKVIVVVALMGASFVAGWNSRSDFSGEIRSEVNKQMSVVKQAQ